jgi:hypothetical protein
MMAGRIGMGLQSSKRKGARRLLTRSGKAYRIGQAADEFAAMAAE